jgi:Flp pilus assembly protein TadG
MTSHSFRRLRRDATGQSMVEMAMILPFIVVIVLGVIETSYALLDHHVVVKLSREGANLISRDATLTDAYTAMRNMSTSPVDFTSRSKIIFSAVKRVSTVGATNEGWNILYQQHTFGASVSGNSALVSAATASDFGGAPDYIAFNSDNAAALRVTSLPLNFQPLGSTTYVAEIFSTHPLITPFDRFGVNIPTSLYSIAYF